MDPEQWREIDRILQQALSRPPEKLAAFLEEACGGDENLRREVESLVEHEWRAGSFIASPACGPLTEDQPEQASPDLLGKSLLHYRILEKIGEGGMGVVYRAHDSHLNRSVAIKLLPPGKMADTERRKRFIHEARAASALNHPNIITIHDISNADGIDFIAMEYVAGKPLTQLIGNKGLPLRQALKYGIQIADALEKAHRAGIVHRDLKPSNIMVTEDGLVKVLDFGLAKLTQLARDGADLSRSAESMTQSGAIVGTAAYMSPEQAEGKAVDARSDIFTYGAVLYEMVTGRRAFKGDSNISTPSAILHEEPEPVSRVAAGIPQELERIIIRCLKKDPERRFQHMDDVKIALEELEEAPAKPERLRTLYWIVAGALLVIGTGLWVFLRVLPREAKLPPVRIVPVTTSGGGDPSLSPDGNWIAFRWNGEERDNWDICVKEVDGPGLNRLTRDPADDRLPAWSPDGRQIAFLRGSGDVWARWGLYLISPLGGGERKISEALCSRPSWSPDGKAIALADRKSPSEPWSIWLLSLETLEKKQITAPAAGWVGDDSPSFSPDGRYLVFTRGPETVTSALYVMRFPGGEPKLLTDYYSPWHPCWTSDSREIVFETREMALWRVSLDGGEPRRVPTRGESVYKPAISRNRLAYVSSRRNQDVWKLKLTGQEMMKAPSEPLVSWSSGEGSPRISPDGSRIVFVSLRSGSPEIWVCSADGTRELKLTDMKSASTGSPTWSPDGKSIAFDSNKSGNVDIYAVGAAGGPVRRITTDSTEEVIPGWSGDGRWIYFGSNRSGSWQIWKMPSEGGKAIQITTNGAVAARESADGHLYYCDYFNQRKGLWRIPASGGAESLVLDKAISPVAWDLSDRGIYFIDFDAKPMATICLYDFAQRRVKNLAPISNNPGYEASNGVSISPGGRWLVYSGGIVTSDIMMIDNFR